MIIGFIFAVWVVVMSLPEASIYLEPMEKKP